jgi:hypothetical protein
MQEFPPVRRQAGNDANTRQLPDSRQRSSPPPSSKEDERNADRLVQTLVSSSLSRCEIKAERRSAVSQLLESLVYPFVCRLSLREGNWLGDARTLRSITQSIDKSCVIIEKYIDPENREQTFLKFHLDTLLFRCFGDPTGMLPVRDSWNVDPLFSGWMNRFVNRAIAKKDYSFIYSLQKGSKKGWPALGPLKMAAAYKKHAQRFSEFHGCVTSPDLAQEIVDVSRMVFRGNDRMVTTKFIPRGSACLQKQRRAGGALSLFEAFDFPTEKEEKDSGKLRALNEKIEAWRAREYARAIRIVQQDLVSTEAQHADPFTGKVVPLSEETRFERLNEDHRGICDLDILAIPEPGKFRVISKGDGHLGSILQPIQGVMLDCWKHREESTMLRDDLTEKVQSMYDNTAMLGEDRMFCSIDYEAATDLIKKSATILALAGLEENKFYQYALLSLGEGIARYPPVYETFEVVVDGKKEERKRKVQEAFQCESLDGQPMGHVLSFPLLCTINLAVYRMAVRRWAREPGKTARIHMIKVMLDNVIVNGDDLLCVCREDFYPYFMSTCKEVGFKVSVGKQYLSRTGAMINSQLFQLVGKRVVRRGYLNLNIVKGVSVKKTTDMEATPTQISRDCNKMIELCPWTKCVIPAVMKRWGPDWFGKQFQPNWYLPVHLGGCGFDIKYAPSTWKITKSQRFIAACYINDPSLQLYRRKGVDVPTLKYAQALVKFSMIPSVSDYVMNEFESEGTDAIDGWMNKICYASRIKEGAVRLEADKVFANTFLGRKSKRNAWIKPASLETIRDFMKVRLFSFPTPPAPPFASFTQPDMPLIQHHNFFFAKHTRSSNLEQGGTGGPDAHFTAVNVARTWSKGFAGVTDRDLLEFSRSGRQAYVACSLDSGRGVQASLFPPVIIDAVDLSPQDWIRRENDDNEKMLMLGLNPKSQRDQLRFVELRTSSDSEFIHMQRLAC